MFKIKLNKKLLLVPIVITVMIAFVGCSGNPDYNSNCNINNNDRQYRDNCNDLNNRYNTNSSKGKTTIINNNRYSNVKKPQKTKKNNSFKTKSKASKSFKSKSNTRSSRSSRSHR